MAETKAPAEAAEGEEEDEKYKLPDILLTEFTPQEVNNMQHLFEERQRGDATLEKTFCDFRRKVEHLENMIAERKALGVWNPTLPPPLAAEGAAAASPPSLQADSGTRA